MLVKLIVIIISVVSLAQGQLTAAQEQKDCVACIMNGKHWCGQYTSPFKKTICDTKENINPALCRSPIGIKSTDCESPIMNPKYPGRRVGGSLWDT